MSLFPADNSSATGLNTEMLAQRHNTQHVATTMTDDAVLRLRKVRVNFRGLIALDQVDLDLPPGCITALVGPNGAGKTTCFNVISGLLRPQRGSVHLRGEDGKLRDITGLSPHQVARLGVGRSFQNLRLLQELTVSANLQVALDPPTLREQMVDTVRLRRARAGTDVRLDEILCRFKLQSKAGVRTRELSYGEQKLVSLARAYSCASRLLLLDEPTSGVDPKSLQGLVDIIRSLLDGGRTVCIVEHSTEMVRQVADHVIFMNQGNVVAAGPTHEILDDPKLADLYFGSA